jgi:hypothetical protein
MKPAHGVVFALRLATAVFIAGITGTFLAGPARAADPTTADCLSASENSLALRGQHQLRAARAQLLVCAHASCPADVRMECTRRVSEINSAMPTVVFEAKDASGNDISAVRVSMDGQPLVDRLEGTAVSIDPGEHSFAFEAPGQGTVQKKFVIREGEKDRREVISFGKSGAGAAAANTPGSSPGTVPPPGAPAAPMSESGSSGATTKRTLGFVVGGVGLAGVGVGVTMLVLASSLSSRSDSEDAAVPGSGHSDHEAAVSDQVIGFIAGGVGVAALGVGVVLVLTSGHAASAAAAQPPAASVRITPDVGPRHAGLGVIATF